MNNNARKYNRYNEVDERILALFAEKQRKGLFVYCMILIISLYVSTLYSSQVLRKTSEDIVQNFICEFLG